ncbi:HNH endonuclease [Staphylococcus hominis]|uniref:HNH endonuclease n=1 Tax=Staphylococcus hominis TaxID=1290 RepID=UPI001F1FA508|nr:HNH endonuclease signature motif containing protein [Staphylococcus hominis]MCE4976626.1 HNH endonuclease [Staphylococcus hominis]
MSKAYADYIEQRTKNKGFYSNAKWRKTRLKVLARDHFECVMCNAEGRLTINQKQSLEVDHIKELEIRPDLAYELSNLRTLCKFHHNKRHGRFEHNPNSRKNKFNDENW